MMEVIDLKIRLLGYWHAGGGRGAGAVVDSVVRRDASGLPLLPGRHLKGLLSDACRRAESWSWPGFEQGITALLFGSAAASDTGTHAGSTPGSLRISDARLPQGLAEWLGSDSGRQFQPHLFRDFYATAIDGESGIAREKSLRGIEVSIPLELVATVGPVPGGRPPAGWQERIEALLPLVDAVGAHRSRGLGRAVLSLKEKQA